MAFAMANNSNPSAMTAAACCISAAEIEGRLDGAEVGFMVGVVLGPAHVMNSDASGQTKYIYVISSNYVGEFAYLRNVSH